MKHSVEGGQNVIEHFAARYGTEVTISVDIAAKSRSGFDMKTERVIRDNAPTLKFKTADSEGE